MNRLGTASASMLFVTLLSGHVHADEINTSVTASAVTGEKDGEILNKESGDTQAEILPDADTAAEPNAEQSAEPGAEPTAEQNVVPVASVITPVSIEPLVPIESGRNDSNPIWYKDGNKLSFERSRQGKKEILITSEKGELLRKIYVNAAADDEFAFLLPGVTDTVSYNAGISWSPDGSNYVFMSNGGEGNYDLYLGNSLDENTERLTDYVGKDGQAQWSPIDNQFVFVSGRSGSGDLFMFDMTTRQSRQLTRATSPFLYPEWSPNGKSIAVISGNNENHDIYLLRNFSNEDDSMVQVTNWNADDLRPMWSPDGQKIAFYTNYNESGDDRIWSIAVVDVSVSMPVKHEELVNSIVAYNVMPDVERGPAWLPDSQKMAYVKNSKQEYNPIYVVDITTGSSSMLLTDTRMNHDVVCSRDGKLAFRAQVEQWDQIYVAKLPENN